MARIIWHGSFLRVYMCVCVCVEYYFPANSVDGKTNHTYIQADIYMSDSVSLHHTHLYTHAVLLLVVAAVLLSTDGRQCSTFISLLAACLLFFTFYITGQFLWRVNRRALVPYRAAGAETCDGTALSRHGDELKLSACLTAVFVQTFVRSKNLSFHTYTRRTNHTQVFNLPTLKHMCVLHAMHVCIIHLNTWPLGWPVAARWIVSMRYD